MNDGKYGRLYPEGAVEKARAILAVTAAELVQAGTPSAAIQEALDDLDRLGFPEDEPLFLLRGQDKEASEFVHAYAQMVRDHPQPCVRALDADRIDAHADAMERWLPRKWPD